MIISEFWRKKQDRTFYVFAWQAAVPPVAGRRRCFHSWRTACIWLKDYVVKIFQTVNFRSFRDSSAGVLGGFGAGVTASSRGQADRPASDSVARVLSGFLISGGFCC